MGALKLGRGGGGNCTGRFGNLLKLFRACNLDSNGSEIRCRIAEVHITQACSMSTAKFKHIKQHMH